MKKQNPYSGNNFNVQDDAEDILRHKRQFDQHAHVTDEDLFDDPNAARSTRSAHFEGAAGGNDMGQADYENLFKAADMGGAVMDEMPEEGPIYHSDEEFEALKKEAGEAKLRAMAEVDNIRKRLQREKEEAVRYAASSVLADILPSLDNLDLALEHAKGKEACKDFFIGVDMTRKLLLDALKKHGLEPVGCLGDEFDPNFHEAVGMNAHPDYADNHVCGLMSKGYKLNDRLLRPARVVVSKK